jgi:peptidoglycan/LPS O-acetylase OafA/YrhL
LLLITLWLARRTLPNVPNAGSILVSVLTIASLYFFNRDDALDNWAIYFFGAYGLGALIHWTVREKRGMGWLALIVAIAAGALAVDFRLRIAVALVTAIALGIARYTGFIKKWPQSRSVAWLGKISYSIFLVHYPICLVVNAMFERFVPHAPTFQAMGMVLAWGTSIAGGAFFFKFVECRAQLLLANGNQVLRTPA